MKAVFLVSDCLVRDSDGHALSATTGAALATLADQGHFLVLLNPPHGAGQAGKSVGEATQATHLAEWVEKSGGRVDAMAHCPHAPDETCFCWGTQPGLLLETARDLDIHLDESYVICDSPQDVLMTYTAGCRPVLVLGGRTIEEIFEGFQPEPADYPISPDLARAADYVLCEDEISAAWGHPRPRTNVAMDDTESLLTWPDGIAPLALPTVTAFSPVEVKEPIRPVQVLRNSGRLLLLTVMGGVWLSLGIAYLLTHLYRVKPFPQFVWYLTLQFIPRPVRGLLFIVTGVIVLLLALWNIRRAAPALRWGKPRQE